jgi:hypothetical protein
MFLSPEANNEARTESHGLDRWGAIQPATSGLQILSEQGRDGPRLVGSRQLCQILTRALSAWVAVGQGDLARI